MSAGERALRLGIYCGLAAVKLGDRSYAVRFLDRQISDVTEAEYLEVTLEIQRKLVEAGIIGPDEDPFEETLDELVARLGQSEVRELLR